MHEEKIISQIRLAQSGDLDVQAGIVADNLNLVRSVVQRFGLRGEEWDDLFQTGCIGLIKAIQRFDCTRAVRFSTYAVPMIIGELKQYFRDNQKIHVSRSMKELAQRVRMTERSLGDKLNREPTIQEIAQELCVLPAEIAAAMESQRPVSSLDEPQGGSDETVTLLEMLSADTTRPDDIERLFLSEQLSMLSLRDREILMMRFWRDKTQQEVAERLGISQVQVSRLEKKAILFLRKKVLEMKNK